MVIISHFHGDHINGLITADRSLAFPNAEILVPAVEHKYWMDDGEMSRAPQGASKACSRTRAACSTARCCKRVRTYEWGKEVVPGITAVGTPGHTPGHTSLIVVVRQQARSIVQADVTHVPYLFARNPGWHAFDDQDPAMAEATRRKVYDMLVAEKMMVQGFHYPFPALAHVEKTATGYREVDGGVESDDLIAPHHDEQRRPPARAAFSCVACTQSSERDCAGQRAAVRAVERSHTIRPTAGRPADTIQGGHHDRVTRRRLLGGAAAITAATT